MRILIASVVLFLAVYLGAVVGLRLAIATIPKFVPAPDLSYHAPLYQSDIDYSDGSNILPNYQLQKALPIQNSGSLR